MKANASLPKVINMDHKILLLDIPKPPFFKNNPCTIYHLTFVTLTASKILYPGRFGELETLAHVITCSKSWQTKLDT